MIEQVIAYYQEMVRLKDNGIPIDFEKVAQAMATTLKASIQNAPSPPQAQTEI